MSGEPVPERSGHMWCHPCSEHVPNEAVITHMKLIHDLDVHRWPDGAPVVIDTTLTPDDFTEQPT